MFSEISWEMAKEAALAWRLTCYLSLLCLQPSVYTRPHPPVANGNLRPPANAEALPTAAPEEEDNSFKDFSSGPNQFSPVGANTKHLDR